jgi:hypothetical protein
VLRWARVVGRALPLVLVVTACATAGPAPSSLPLRQVVLYRNGLGYFEHAGSPASNRLKMRLRAGEVDDVMKTLAVLSRDDNAAVGAVAALRRVNDQGDVDLDLAVPTDHEITVSYASPTPVWRSTYKLVLGDGDDSAHRLVELRDNLQAIEKNPAAGPLRKQLNEELARAVRATEELSHKTAELVAARDEKRAKLRTELEDLAYDRPL